MKRVAIVGCRPPVSGSYDIWRIYHLISRDVQEFVAELPAGTIIISGGARGVDSIASTIAGRRGLEVIEVKSRTFVRNTCIVGLSDEVHAWLAPWSQMTPNLVMQAQAASKPTTVHEPWRKPS